MTAVLKRRVCGVAPKVLTAVLRSLERDGMVIRRVYTGSPLRVDYRLTPLGKSLFQAVEGLRVWAERRIVRVADARTRYDQALKSRSGPVQGPVRGPRFHR